MTYLTHSPTQVPVTNAPSDKGDTQTPTERPTGRPSAHLEDYKDLPLYGTYLQAKANATALIGTKAAAFFSTFFYKEVSLEGECTDWNNFRVGSLISPFDTFYFSSITLSSGYVDLSNITEGMKVITTTCREATKLEAILEALIYKRSNIVSCGGNQWKISACSAFVSLCINCVSGCRTCPG